MMVHVLLLQAIEIIIVSVAEMMPGGELLADPSVVANLFETSSAVAVILVSIVVCVWRRCVSCWYVSCRVVMCIATQWCVVLRCGVWCCVV